ncbi:MAG TPA: DsbA family protein, partial [Candidatus Thermoplasmatota archaeon]|nr:DsbA family protein [Candidatus Thermoplasmatota archaeon]
SDLHCPYAYLAAYRLRKVLPEFRGRVEVEHRCLSLEYTNERPTPKDVLDNETPLILLEEPGIPYAPWHRPAWEWPGTMWPAFEAVKCAERQSWELANDLDWLLREAFFAGSRCISLRHVILDLAEHAGLDMKRFREDFDSGVTKRGVLEDARKGWDELDLPVSPTFILPDGSWRVNPAAPKVHLDEHRHHRVTKVDPAPAKGAAALDVYRDLLKATALGG